MAQPILVKDSNGVWREPSITSYSNERELQNLVVKSPELLTGEALATVDEYFIPGIGYVDIVGVGADGGVTIVECKLQANSEIRRAVVGQLLAYAGGLWQMPYEQFAAGWATRAQSSLADDVRSATGSDDDDESIRAKVADGLNRGAFTLVIAVDGITDELKRIIEYLNGVTSDEVKVLGLELQYVKERDTEILIPRTYGEGQKKTASVAPSARWNAETFAAEIAELDDSERTVVEALMAHGQAHATPWWGVGQTPGMSWLYNVNGTKLSLFQLYLRSNGVVVSPGIGALAGSPAAGPRLAQKVLERLREFPAFVPHLAHVIDGELNKYPPIPMKEALGVIGGVDAFLAAVDEARTTASDV